MSSPNLSYLVTTFNKLAYLKITLPLIIENCKNDEEIIVIDGGSKDGTGDYLKSLKEQGKIHHYISEPDKGEAHGFNKGMLMAKGALLKIMSDDDAYDFNVVAACKEHMLKHKDVDVIGGNGVTANLVAKDMNYNYTDFGKLFSDWKNHQGNCWFCGLSLMIRKSSLPFLGLFHTGITMIDFEYVARISSLRPKVSFCEAYSYVNIVSESSNSVKKFRILHKEQEKIDRFYFNKNKLIKQSALIDFKQRIKSVLKTGKEKISNAHPFEKVFFESVELLKTANNKPVTFIKAD